MPWVVLIFLFLSMAKQFKKSHEKSQASVVTPKESKPVNIQASQVAEPKALWIFLIIFVLALVLYGNTMQNGYSMDDELVTLNQPNVESGLAGIPKIISARYSVNNKQHYEYRPIALVTYAIEYQFFGRNPGPSHFFNIMIYALCSLLVYLIIKKLFPDHHWSLGLLAALIFTIHPMHSEVVASLKNRDEMLALIFALLALSAFINFTDRRKWKYIGYGFIYFMLALFSKKSAMPFIAIIPLVIILTRKVNPYKVIGLTAAIFLTISISGRIYLKSVLERGDTLREMFFFENPLYSGLYGLGEKFMMAIASFGYYVKMMFVPYPLVSYYGYNTFEGFHFTLNHAIGLIAGAGIIFILVKYFKTNKPLIVGLVLFCVSISMFINLFAPAVGIVAERFAFEASVGFALLLASGVLMFTKSFEIKKQTRFAQMPSSIKFLFIGLTLISAIVIVPRNKAWYSMSSLYHTDVKIVPECTKLHSLLGTMHANLLNSHVRGDTALTLPALQVHSDSAISYFKKALKIYPNYIAVNNNLGTIYFTYKTNLDSAGYYFNRACELDTDYVEAYFNLGNYFDQRAELSAQKLSWINAAVKNDTSLTGDAKHAKEVSKGLDRNDELFLKLIALKTQLNTIFNNYASGKGKGDPKGSVLDALLYYFKQMKIMKGIELDHMGLADGTIEMFRKVSKSGNPNYLAFAVDSIVNHYYFQPMTTALVKDGSIKESDLNNTLRTTIRMEMREYRSKCIMHLKKSMRLNKSYMTAYTKLSQVLPRWGMYDDLIEIHQEALKNPLYKSYSINFSLADAYFLKGDYKKCAELLIIALKEMQKVTTRINNVFSNFSAAQNNFVLSTLTRAKDNNRQNVAFYINKYMYQISNKYPYETVQIQQLFNMVKSL